MPYRYFFGLFVGAVFALFVAAGSFLITLGTPLESGRWVNECLTIKRTAAEKHNPKIIILSGSNSLFGFSAERLTNVHGIPTVNAAVHAGLGIEYILHYGRQLFVPGRIFVLPLEYQLYGERKLANSAVLHQMAGYDPQYFWDMPVVDKLTTIFQISPMDRVRLVKNSMWASPRSDTEGYQSRTLNAYGDETANRIEDRTRSMFEKVKAHAPDVFLHHDDAWQAIAKFSADAKSAGATVVLAHPNIYSGALDLQRNDSFFREIQTRADAINLQVVGTPSASVFNDENVFDTEYHQNTHGQMRSTDRLVRELRAAKVI